MRKEIFAEGEYYHIYNRGVDKRNIFEDKLDLHRFFQSMEEFNVLEPIGSLYENSFRKKKIELGGQASKLVNIICYCLNPNHFHFLLEQVEDKGIEKFIQRLGTGYVRYFNDKYKRSGALFQGPYKAVHVGSNTYLLHVSAYINLNDLIHYQLGGQASKASKLVKSRSSWDEYVGVNTRGKNLCKKDIILGQFSNKKEYAEFAKSSIQDTLRRREGNDKMLRSLILE